jgi:hypothetical protein
MAPYELLHVFGKTQDISHAPTTEDQKAADLRIFRQIPINTLQQLNVSM